MNGGELVADVLVRHGVRALFALCGGHIAPILVASHRRGIRVIDTRHEATAVFAADAAARLGCTPELCQLAIDILSWQRLRNRLPSRLPRKVKVAHKTGTTAHNYNDAGIIYLGDEPAFILSAFTDGVPDELPNGDAG